MIIKLKHFLFTFHINCDAKWAQPTHVCEANVVCQRPTCGSCAMVWPCQAQCDDNDRGGQTIPFTGKLDQCTSYNYQKIMEEGMKINKLILLRLLVFWVEVYHPWEAKIFYQIKKISLSLWLLNNENPTTYFSSPLITINTSFISEQSETIYKSQPHTDLFSTSLHDIVETYGLTNKCKKLWYYMVFTW